MKRILWLVVIALMGMAACAEPLEKCTDNSQCNSGQKCENWKCVQSSNIVLRGGIGTLGPAPEASGEVRLINQGLSTSYSVCKGDICLRNGGITP